MLDFEKLGAFYLGRRVDTRTDELTDELVLYDSRDLTTHAVIIGMTGSGKTGLGIGLLEEAALDHIPVIAIDPKGDLGNLLLTFPKLQPGDFRPWVNSRQAADRGVTADEHAKAEASAWKKGLADWGQDGERISRLRNSADMAIYTPGSDAGLPISVLQSFAAPARELVEDVELNRERIQATATGLLSLLGIDADPLTSREHILLSRILDGHWQRGLDLDIAVQRQCLFALDFGDGPAAANWDGAERLPQTVDDIVDQPPEGRDSPIARQPPQRRPITRNGKNSFGSGSGATSVSGRKEARSSG